MKRRAAGAAMVLFTVLLSGCGPTYEAPEIRSYDVPLPDGQVVSCVSFNDPNYGTEFECIDSTARRP